MEAGEIVSLCHYYTLVVDLLECTGITHPHNKISETTDGGKDRLEVYENCIIALEFFVPSQKERIVFQPSGANC